MQLVVGLLDFNSKADYLIEELMKIEPFPKIFDNVNYIKGKIIVPKECKNKIHSPRGNVDVLFAPTILEANQLYIPVNGRLLILTSYPIIGILYEGGLGLPPKELLPLEVKHLIKAHSSAIVTNYILTEGQTSPYLLIKRMGHELGHTFGLTHGSLEHKCIMSPQNYSYFCGKCSKKLERFYNEHSGTIKSEIKR